MEYTYLVASATTVIISIILFFTNRYNPPVRWASITSFCVFFGGLSVIITDIINPSLKLSPYKDLIPSLLNLAGALNLFAYYYLPFCYLMFSISYSNFFLKKWPNSRKTIAVLGILPGIFMFIFFPLSDFVSFYDYHFSHTVLTILVIPYFIIGNSILIYSYFNAKNIKSKKEIFNVNIFIVPAMTGVLIFSHLSVGFRAVHLYAYRSIPMFYLFIMFVILIMKEGTLGVRLRFERYRLDSAIQMLSTGTAVMNHAIKNELANISLGAHIFETSPAIQNDPNLNQTLQILLGSIQNMSALVSRFNEHMQEVVLDESQLNLIDLTEKSLAQFNALISSKNIHISKDYACDNSVLLCDPVHLTEVLNNIIKNAIEAMDKGGKIEIQIYQHQERLILAVKDNGVGISKENLSRVMEPFFSTKNHKQNFGLGLSYCYNVMKKHGGSLEIHSEEHLGTTVFLSFAPKKCNLPLQNPVKSFENINYPNSPFDVKNLISN